MKIEKITENKVRIILNLDDLKAKNIDLHSLMSNSIESQNLFIDMLEEAERTVGFYTKDCKILIEALASSDGNFIFTITRVLPEDDSLKKKNVRIKRKTANTNFKKAIYQFNSFEEFCNFCAYIDNTKLKGLQGFAKNSSLYSYKNTYFLVISDINSNYPNLKGFYAAISEFAKCINQTPTFESKLMEYGKPIMKRNAINKCTEYFG